MDEMKEIKELVNNLRMANDQMAEEIRAVMTENHRLNEKNARLEEILKENGLTYTEAPTPPNVLPGNAIMWWRTLKMFFFNEF